MTDDLTAADRAERARTVWEMYRDLHGERIHYLIADLLHLADVDEHPGGGDYAAQRAAAHYDAERPVWGKTPVYLAQYRPAGKDWITVARGDETVEAHEVASCMWRLMQKADLRTGEIQMHINDLAQGSVITADNGTAFRVIRQD